MKSTTSSLLLCLGFTMTLAACGSVKPALLCTQTQHDVIQAENTRLVARKVVIDGYVRGEPIPQENASLASRKELVAAYVRGYNRAFDDLVEASKEFNATCAGKPGFWDKKPA